MPLSELSLRGGCSRLVSHRNCGLLAKVAQGFLAARLGQSRLEASLQSLEGSSALLWGASTEIPSMHTEQGTASWHQGHCHPLPCPQTPTAKARGAAPPQGQPLPSLPHLGHIFLTMSCKKTPKLRTFSRLGKHPEPLPAFHPLTDHCKQLFPLFLFLLVFFITL